MDSVWGQEEGCKMTRQAQGKVETEASRGSFLHAREEAQPKSAKERGKYRIWYYSIL